VRGGDGRAVRRGRAAAVVRQRRLLHRPQEVADLFLSPGDGHRPLPALCLTNDIAVVTVLTGARVSAAASGAYGSVIRRLRGITLRKASREPKWRTKGKELHTGYTSSWR